jgi:excisionase family DNA binding protein
MEEQRKHLLTAREAADYLRVSLATLNRMDKEGELAPFRTPGGHRRYSLEMLNGYLERSRQRSLSASLSITQQGKNAPRDHRSDRGVRILVADSEPDTVQWIISALREDRDVYEFASASNGYEVGVQVVAFQPDLIVLSMAKPEIDSVEVCRKIKGDPQTGHIRIVGVVGFAEESNIEEMLHCGADDCLIKPLQFEELQRSVRYLTSRKGKDLITASGRDWTRP